MAAMGLVTSSNSGDGRCTHVPNFTSAYVRNGDVVDAPYGIYVPRWWC
jgi:hypothetical protein